ncbi:hypothetical protein OROMI_034007 [Orobanche minor]
MKSETPYGRNTKCYGCNKHSEQIAERRSHVTAVTSKGYDRNSSMLRP